MRMRKSVWTVLGLVGLSLLMCGSAEAQTSGEPPPQPSLEENRSAASPTARVSEDEADLRRTVARLEWEVAQLRADVAELRARLGEQQGVGGSGAAGQAGTGTAGGEARGTSEATAHYTGTVQEVRPQAIVIGDEAGTLLTLDVGRDTKVFRGDGRRIEVQQLQTGSRVNVAVDLLADGRNEAVEITEQPAR
jgi:hypothetical protein